MNSKKLSLVLSAVIMLLKFLCASVLLAQTHFTVSGYIYDAETGETLIGAGVKSCKDAKVAVSNSYGFYSLSLSDGEALITFSHIGYENKNIALTIKKDTIVNIHLKPGESLKEAVVSSYGESGIGSVQAGIMDIPLERILNTPALFGEPDILKTIQMMPGVQGGFEGSSGIFVRGGGVDENLFLLDGVPMYNVSHLLGIFSSFTPEAVKKVTFYKGAFPARYGGRVSSIIDIRTNDGDLYKTKGSLSVGMLNNKIHLEGPILKGKLSYSVSLRGMHSLVFAPVIKWAGSDLNYYFYDINSKIVWRANEKDKLFFTFYNGEDKLRYNNLNRKTLGNPGEKGVKMNMGWGNIVSALRWNHIYGSKLFSNFSFSYNGYYMRSKYAMYPEKKTETKVTIDKSDLGSGIRDFNLNADWDYMASDSHLMRIGLAATWHKYAPEIEYTRLNALGDKTLFHNKDNNHYGGIETAVYLEDDWKPVSWFELNAGLRCTIMTSGENQRDSWQPRLSSRIDFGQGFAAKISYAKTSQYVHLLSNSVLFLPTDLWIPVTENIRPVYADQFSAGGYYDGLKGWEFSIEAYYKKSENILEYKDGVSFFGDYSNWERRVSQGISRSLGMELYIQKTIGKTTGWLSYTLSKTERRFPDMTVNLGMWFPYKYDRRHNFVISVTHKFSKKIDITGSWSFLSGGMITAPEGAAFFYIGQSNNGTLSGKFYSGEYYTTRNNYRLPPSHRLNLSLNLRKTLRRGERCWNIGVYNVYNSLNPNLIYATSASDSGRETIKLKKVTIFPVLPYVSYNFKF